eukprot:129778-Pleurochrysis_carterae.AAC.1
MLCLSWLTLAAPRVLPSPAFPGSPDCKTHRPAPARSSGVAIQQRLSPCEAVGRHRRDTWGGLCRWP